jgi:ABC-type nickel/cobalt efflux system permease component RcnA
MYATRRYRPTPPAQIRLLFAAATILGAGALCLAVIVAYGWGAAAAENASQNLISTALVLLLLVFVLWLWRHLATTREEMRRPRRFL